MRKFNLFKEIIVANRDNLKSAVDSGKIFGIKIDGSICYEPFAHNDILIYKGSPDTNLDMKAGFGKNYQILEDGDRVLIKAFGNWQEIIGLNTPRATYDDTTADGVDEFSTKEMENIGWHAAEFNIKYRTLVELLEEKCDGTLICIEQEEPYQFSGLGFVDDLQNARDVLFDFCQREVKRIMAHDEDFAKENLNEDELEAAEFFKAI